jgi:hypothetical protein
MLETLGIWLRRRNPAGAETIIAPRQILSLSPARRAGTAGQTSYCGSAGWTKKNTTICGRAQWSLTNEAELAVRLVEA